MAVSDYPAQSAVGGYPVRLEVQRPASQSRITNFPLGIGMMIRAILLIPHLAILYALSLVAQIVYFIACFAILFTGTYPQGMYNMVAGVMRWSANVSGYLLSLYDDYPPFSTGVSAGYPMSYEVDYPAQSSRLLNFPLYIGGFIRIVLLIPNLVVLVAFSILAYVIMIIAPFAILFTGSYPEGMHSFVTGTVRWSFRMNAYMSGLTDAYPPFGLK